MSTLDYPMSGPFTCISKKNSKSDINFLILVVLMSDYIDVVVYSGMVWIQILQRSKNVFYIQILYL